MNKLEGPIPHGPQIGGFLISKSCSEDTTHRPLSPTSQQEGDEEHMNGFEWIVVLMGYGSGMVIGISMENIVCTDKAIYWLLKNDRGKGVYW